MTYLKGGIFVNSPKENYGDSINKIITENSVKKINVNQYLARYAFEFAAAAGGNNPTFAIDSAGSYVALPYKKLIMKSVKSTFQWSNGVYVSATPHIITLQNSSPQLDDRKNDFNISGLSTATTTKETLLVTLTQFVITPDFSAYPTPPYLFGQEGFSLQWRPFVNAYPFVNFAYLIGDFARCQTDFLFEAF